MRLRNPIHAYSAQMHWDENIPQTLHATDRDGELTLCGRPIGIQTCWQSLQDAGGSVSCKTCTRVLKARNIYDSYIGPTTTIFKGECFVSGEVILNNFGWTPPDRTFEHYFAYGHLPSGRLLKVARELTSNDLLGVEEYQTTIYEHWCTHTTDSDDEPHCFKMYDLKPETDNSCVVQHMSRQIQITVLRHEAWPLIIPGPNQEVREVEYDVRLFCDWYRGARQLGRPITPSDIEIDNLPGFTVIGIPDGEADVVCLEWPTADFEGALTSTVRHAESGVTKIEICGDGIAISLEQLKRGVANQIRRSLRRYGPDLSLQSCLEG